MPDAPDNLTIESLLVGWDMLYDAMTEAAKEFGFKFEAEFIDGDPVVALTLHPSHEVES